MKFETFESLWTQWTGEWYKNAKVKVGETMVPVSAFCTLKPDYSGVILKRYNVIKDIFKKKYFQDKGKNKRISLYKRAAIITYAINSASPLICNSVFEGSLDPYLLKQRLAFYIGIGSIIQGFPEATVKVAYMKSGELFDFTNLDIIEFRSGQEGSVEKDDFLTSVYKDLFFSELYGNYNILTMANVFGLLTEKSSILPQTLVVPKQAEHPNE